VGSSAPPALATFQNRLYAAWKGRATDQRIWYAAFDGSQWSSQAPIAGAVTSGGPSLSVFDKKLYAAWRGNDAMLATASFDGSGWSNASKPAPAPAIVANSHPFTPQMIASTALTGVDQGKYGDCVFESSVVATATTPRGQTALSKAILQNADGSYTVTFPGDPQRPTQVSQSDLTTTHVHDSAAWAAILETALIISNPSMAGGHPPPNAIGAADGSKPTPAQYALHLLTGSLASKDVATSTKIGKRIADALSSGKPVVAFCANNDDGALVSGHEWTVTACDPQEGQITLRNPWGKFKTAGTSKGGVNYDGNAEVSMTLQQFGQFYKEVTFGYDKG
jgi:hypothetical protein